jgi:ABC-type sugar transport system ATPase subunit
MPSLLKRTPRNHGAAAKRNYQRRLRRLLRRMAWNEMFSHEINELSPAQQRIIEQMRRLVQDAKIVSNLSTPPRRNRMKYAGVSTK